MITISHLLSLQIFLCILEFWRGNRSSKPEPDRHTKNHLGFRKKGIISSNRTVTHGSTGEIVQINTRVPQPWWYGERDFQRGDLQEIERRVLERKEETERGKEREKGRDRKEMSGD